MNLKSLSQWNQPLIRITHKTRSASAVKISSRALYSRRAVTSHSRSRFFFILFFFFLEQRAFHSRCFVLKLILISFVNKRVRSLLLLIFEIRTWFTPRVRPDVNTNVSQISGASFIYSESTRRILLSGILREMWRYDAN